MRSKSFKNFICALLISCAAGCSVEYNKDIAAERARDYIFEQIPKMSPENASYIKYTYPKILMAPIYYTDKMDEKNIYWDWGYSYTSPVNYSKSREYEQAAFTWDLPNPKVSIMVIGTCYDNFQGWYPIRLIFRETAQTEETNTARKSDKRPDIMKLPTTGSVSNSGDY